MASRVTWGSSTRLSANTTPSLGSSPVAGCASATAARQAASTSTPKPAPSPVVMSAVSDANSASVRESSRKPSTEETSAADRLAPLPDSLESGPQGRPEAGGASVAASSPKPLARRRKKVPYSGPDAPPTVEISVSGERENGAGGVRTASSPAWRHGGEAALQVAAVVGVTDRRVEVCVRLVTGVIVIQPRESASSRIRREVDPSRVSGHGAPSDAPAQGGV